MKVIPFIYEDIDDVVANCYVIINEKNNCVVVDPSVDYDGVINFIKKNNLVCRGVLLTHAHFDHMRGVDRTCKQLNAKLYVGFDDIPALTNARLNGPCMDGCGVVISTIPESICDNQILHLLDEDIKVIYTPYHTVGSVSYYLEKSGMVFTGDSLFKMSVGRDDFPTSKHSLQRDSISKLMRLPDNVKVYPGHGRFTSIGDERMLNPFVKQ